MNDVKHTSTPWERNGPWIEKDGETIGQAFRMVGLHNAVPTANAAFIVRAVNSHEQLVEACKMLLGCMSLAGWESDHAAIAARAALATAEAA